jgi:hypothetical protein
LLLNRQHSAPLHSLVTTQCADVTAPHPWQKSSLQVEPAAATTKGKGGATLKLKKEAEAERGQSEAATALRSLAASAPPVVTRDFNQVLDALIHTQKAVQHAPAIQSGRSSFMTHKQHAPALAAIMAERVVTMGVHHGALAVEPQLQVRFLRRRDPLLALGEVAHTTPTHVPLYGSSLPQRVSVQRLCSMVEEFSEFGIS